MATDRKYWIDRIESFLTVLADNENWAAGEFVDDCSAHPKDTAALILANYDQVKGGNMDMGNGELKRLDTEAEAEALREKLKAAAGPDAPKPGLIFHVGKILTLRDANGNESICQIKAVGRHEMRLRFLSKVGQSNG
jgi:hypothetical protein